MEVIGTYQLLKMKFERLELSEKWKPLLGNLPAAFLAGVLGESAHGKSECMQQFIIELVRFGDVEWHAYETGYSADIQDAVARNNAKHDRYKIHWCNPWKKIQPCKIDFPKCKNDDVNKLFGDLVNRLIRRNRSKYHIIDSIDRAGFSLEQVMWLWDKFGEKLGLIFLIHAESQGKKPLTAVGAKILFYSSWSLRVHNFIAYPRKSRFSATECYVVWEQRAKELEPAFFGIVPTLKATKGKKRSKRTAKRKSDDKNSDND